MNDWHSSGRFVRFLHGTGVSRSLTARVSPLHGQLCCAERNTRSSLASGVRLLQELCSTRESFVLSLGHSSKTCSNTR